MKLEPFLLDQWLNSHQFGNPPIKFDLATSTGPVWTLTELLEFMDEDKRKAVFDAPLVYTDASGSRTLREAIAAMESVDPSDVQVFTGAEEAIFITYMLAAEPGANVVVPFPCFPPFQAIPKGLGLETRSYYLRPENGFKIDPDEIASLVDANTKLILINLPHNPTGSILDQASLQSMHDFAADRGIQFVVDQVYHPLYHNDQLREREHNPKATSASALPHATVLGDMSKAFSLSGLRVGWVIDRDRHRAEQYCDSRCYLTVSNTPTTQIIAAAAVEHRDAIFGRLRRVATGNLTLLDKFFTRMSDVLGWVRPRGGMTAFPWLTEGGSSRPLCERLAAAGVLVAPGDCWGMPAHFRIGFGATDAGFSESLDLLEKQVREYSVLKKSQAGS